MTLATGSLNFGSGSSAEGMGVHDKPMPKFTVRKNLDALETTTSQTRVL